MEETTTTKAEQTIGDISALLKARCTLLWVVSREEVRAERGIIEAAARAKYETLLWDCATGLSNADGATLDEELANPTAMLRRIGESSGRTVFVLRDLHRWLDPIVVRSVRSLARQLQVQPREDARAIVVLSPSSEIPPELTGHAVVVDYPLPDREEMGRILDDILEQTDGAAPNGGREAAVDAAVGLSAEEAGNCYARSLVTTGAIDPTIVAAEKKRVIARERVLTWTDPDPRGLDAVGGLELLKAWLVQRKLAFSQKARAYGLPAPKGVLLVGVPGCGKSQTAKAVATAWGIPLLRQDFGGLKSKYVGESEQNLRKALATADTVAPCVLWWDEVEKALGSSGGEDGGVSSDQRGTILQWLNDHTSNVFVVATANDVDKLPPELLRKGRFDEIFFVDLPNPIERRAILEATLKQYKREIAGLGDVSTLIAQTEGYSGGEIASVVGSALFTSFADGGRELELRDLEEAALTVVPLSKTASEKIDALRKWAQGRTRPASLNVIEKARTGRALDL